MSEDVALKDATWEDMDEAARRNPATTQEPVLVALLQKRLGQMNADYSDMWRQKESIEDELARVRQERDMLRAR